MYNLFSCSLIFYVFCLPLQDTWAAANDPASGSKTRTRARLHFVQHLNSLLKIRASNVELGPKGAIWASKEEMADFSAKWSPFLDSTSVGVKAVRPSKAMSRCRSPGRRSIEESSIRSPVSKKQCLSTTKKSGNTEFTLTPSVRPSVPLDLSSPLSIRSRLSKEVDEVLDDPQLLVDSRYAPAAHSSSSEKGLSNSLEESYDWSSEVQVGSTDCQVEELNTPRATRPSSGIQQYVNCFDPSQVAFDQAPFQSREGLGEASSLPSHSVLQMPQYRAPPGVLGGVQHPPWLPQGGRGQSLHSGVYQTLGGGGSPSHFQVPRQIQELPVEQNLASAGSGPPPDAQGNSVESSADTSNGAGGPGEGTPSDSLGSHKWYHVPSSDLATVDFTNKSLIFYGEELGKEVLWLKEGSSRLFRPTSLSKSLRELLRYCKLFIPSAPKDPKELPLFELIAKALGDKEEGFLGNWAVGEDKNGIKWDIPDRIKGNLSKSTTPPKEEKLSFAGLSDADSTRIWETLNAPQLKQEDCALEGPFDGKLRPADKRFLEADSKKKLELLTLLKSVAVADLGRDLLTDDLLDKYPDLPIDVQLRLISSHHLFTGIERILMPFLQKSFDSFHKNRKDIQTWILKWCKTSEVKEAVSQAEVLTPSLWSVEDKDKILQAGRAAKSDGTLIFDKSKVAVKRNRSTDGRKQGVRGSAPDRSQQDQGNKSKPSFRPQGPTSAQYRPGGPHQHGSYQLPHQQVPHQHFQGQQFQPMPAGQAFPMPFQQQGYYNPCGTYYGPQFSGQKFFPQQQNSAGNKQFNLRPKGPGKANSGGNRKFHGSNFRGNPKNK